jgi:hypothetical protein
MGEAFGFKVSSEDKLLVEYSPLMDSTMVVENIPSQPFMNLLGKDDHNKDKEEESQNEDKLTVNMNIAKSTIFQLNLA